MPADATTIGARIEALDISLFDEIGAQLSDRDRRSLLALYAGWRSVYGAFDYLEIGSHLGGSLQVLIRDPACTSIVSVDLRPPAQPDERGPSWDYPDNTTARMIDLLNRLDGADMTKVTTFDMSTDTLTVEELPVRPSVCFVDGEHTNAAVLRDARFCKAALRDEGCVVFHDANVVYEALILFLQELEAEDASHRSFFLADTLFVVELGPSHLLESALLKEEVLQNAQGYLWSLSRTSPYRDWFRRSLRYQTLENRLKKLRSLLTGQRLNRG